MTKMHLLRTVVFIVTVALERSSAEDYDQEVLDYSNQQENSAMLSESNELNSGDGGSKYQFLKKPVRNATFVVKIHRNNITVVESSETEEQTYTTAAPKNSKGKLIGPSTLPYQPQDNFIESYKSNEERCTSSLANYPFSVSIQKRGAHYATGALVDKRWILTVAQEFYNVRESIKLFRARLGSVNCKRGGTLVPLKRVEIHPSYAYGTPNFDLALLRMALPVDYTDYIRPIGFSNMKTKLLNAKLMATYWSRVIVKGRVLPASAQERIKQNSMRVSTQRIIPSDKCKKHPSMENITLDESTLCLKPIVPHHSICMPDSGAPIIAEDGLWGITSGWTSDNCKENQSPTIFCRLSMPIVRSWLDSQLLSI